MPFDPGQPSYFLAPGHHVIEDGFEPLFDPGTLEQIGVFGIPGSETIDTILDRVAEAQSKWRGMDQKSRARILHRLADDIEQGDMSKVAKYMSLETGKPYPEAIGEIANIPPIFRYYAELARHDNGRIAGSMQPGSFQFMTYEPLGVSVHIVPYNFPLILGCWTMAASLAAGNGVVLKASPAGTLCAMAFMEFFTALPDGLIACIPGGAEIGASLVESPKTHAIAFTGSVPIGRKVAQAAAAQMKPVVIEAGGNDACIVSKYANVQVAAAGVVTAGFLQSGQVCTSTERVFVHNDVHDEFVDALVERTRTLRIGHGLGTAEIGPMVSESARAKVIQLVTDAVDKGANISLGGRIPPYHKTGWYYEPTILTEVDDNMDVLHQEVFGPVVSIVRVGSFDDAIQRANASEFGLGACLFTSDLEEAFRGVNELEAGMVWVNNPLVDNDALPFGGIKKSGLGRALGPEGLNAFRRPKMAVIDPSACEADWWYPYPDDWFYDGSPGGGRKHS